MSYRCSIIEDGVAYVFLNNTAWKHLSVNTNPIKLQQGLHFLVGLSSPEYDKPSKGGVISRFMLIIFSRSIKIRFVSG